LVHQKIGRWFTKKLVVGSPKNWSLVRQNFGRWFAKILVVGSPATLVRIFYQNFGPDILPKFWSGYFTKNLVGLLNFW